MRVCPNCGFTDSPIWRNKMALRLYVQYCHIEELDSFEPEVAAALRKSPDRYLFKDGIKYRLNPQGYVDRIDAFLCASRGETIMPTENWKGSLYCFHLDMQEALQSSISEKGEPTKDRLKFCSTDYLKEKLIEHLEAENFVDVANFAFLLYQKLLYQKRPIHDNPKEGKQP
jgi:hypothetical protein